MRIGKKFLALALVLIMVAGVLPVTASAADKVAYAVEGGNIYFDPTTGMITHADKGVTSAVIPAEISGVAVTRIRVNAFCDCISLVSITIPEGVTSIGASAFIRCDSLTSVTIPEGVTSIGGYAFASCDSLTSVTILSSVTSIGEHAFIHCGSLTEINVAEINTAYCSVDGVLFDKAKTTLVQYPEGKAETSYVVPSSVTSIGKDAFRNCSSLTSVTIPEGVTSIGGYAFCNCDSLTSVTVPSSVTSIGESAFGDCDSLTSVTILEGVTRIDDWAFAWCGSLTSIAIPKGVTSIAYAFGGCYLLTDVYYEGSKAEWNNIVIDRRNDELLNATIHYNSPMPEPSDPPAIVSELALANKQSVLVDGTPVEFEVYALEDENGGETNYIKLRDLAFILNGTAAQFEVSWDGAVNIITGQPYTQNGTEMDTPFEGDRDYRPTDAVTKVNGVVTEFDAICLTDDDGGEYNYYKLRDLGAVLGFDVSWTSELGIFIETDQPYTDD